MNLWELFVIAVGVSMDAFAVAVCKGLSAKSLKVPQIATVGLYFGGFQMLMPLLGYWLGSSFQAAVSRIDHWIAFVLLAIIGINMIVESRHASEALDASFSFKVMLPLAIATSIDALAVGITFAFLQVDILPAVGFIGLTTFLFSAAGVKIGSIFGARCRSGAELAGGIVLILMGIKILLEHTGILG